MLTAMWLLLVHLKYCVQPRRNDYVFLYFRFGIFNCDTPHWFLYLANVKRISTFWLFLIIFTKYPTTSGLKKKKKWQDKKTKKRCQESISPSLAKGKLSGKNEKIFSNLSGDVMSTSTYFTNYRSCCSQVFYGVVVLKNSKTSKKHTRGGVLH